MTELDKIRKMSADEMTTHLVRLLSCKRCVCADLCKELKNNSKNTGKAPCAVAIRAFLERRVPDDKIRK